MAANSVLLLLYSLCCTCGAFLAAHSRYHGSRLLDRHDLEELEQARTQYESMIGPNVFSSSSTSTTNNYLTEAARKRRHIEIDLLMELQHGDESVDEIMEVWLHEHPSTLEFTTKEDSIRMIAAKYPNWTEPAARLALTLFIKGRFEEAQEQVDKVLHLKPWHFEAVQLQILLCLCRCDTSGAIKWARQGLPPMTQPRKRSAWIKAAVAEASSQLVQCQERPAAVSATATTWQ